MNRQEMPPKTPVVEAPSAIPVSITPPQDSEATPVRPQLRTRSGRTVKAPERYSPQEVCDDDYAPDEYDSDESSLHTSDDECDTDDISSESDADEDGNLAGFVVKSDDEDIDSDVSASGGDGSEIDSGDE
jgi:hypothetical protein